MTKLNSFTASFEKNNDSSVLQRQVERLIRLMENRSYSELWHANMTLEFSFTAEGIIQSISKNSYEHVSYFESLGRY